MITAVFSLSFNFKEKDALVVPKVIDSRKEESSQAPILEDTPSSPLQDLQPYSWHVSTDIENTERLVNILILKCVLFTFSFNYLFLQGYTRNEKSSKQTQGDDAFTIKEPRQVSLLIDHISK